MKKLFICAAIAALTVSCSKEEIPAGRPIAQNVTISESDQEILISLPASRAAIDEDNPLADNLGIFMLAADNLDINEEELPVVWNPSEKNAEYSCWLDNVKAEKAESSNFLKWQAENTVHKYYPTGNWHRFNFYGYYPYQQECTKTAEQRVVTIPVDGKTDIIYANALGTAVPTAADSKGYAYSAAYYRYAEEDAAVHSAPCLNFDHKLVRLKFQIFAKGEIVDGVTNYDKANQMSVKSIKILSVPKTATLVVADKAGTQNGKIDFSAETADLLLCDADGNPIAQTIVKERTEESQPNYKSVGESLLVPAAAEYLIEIEVEGPGVDPTEAVTFTLKKTVKPSAGTFEAGSQYTVNVGIHAPQPTALEATIRAWKNGNSVTDFDL